MKTVFTTGEAAKICKVSQQTIIRCFDTGQLKGFKVPGSRFRRIPRDVLYKFMKANGIPTDAFGVDQKKILGIGLEQSLCKQLTVGLEDDFTLKFTDNVFEGGIFFKRDEPDCVLIDASVDESSLVALSLAIQEREGVIGIIVCEDETNMESLQTLDFTEVFKKPFDPILFIERVRSLLSSDE